MAKERSDSELTHVVTESSRRIYAKSIRLDPESYPEWEQLTQGDRNKVMTSLLPLIMEVLAVVDEEENPKCNRHHGADEPCNNYGWSGCEPEGGYTTEDF